MLRIPHLCDKLFRYYKHILIAAFLAAVVGSYLTSRLSLRSDLEALLPDDFPSVQALEHMRQEVGGSGRLRVVLETADLEAAVRFARDLEPRFLASPLISYVDYENDVAFYRRNALLFLDEETLDSLYDAIERTITSRKQALNPFLIDDLFGEEDAGTNEDELAGWEERYEGRQPRAFNTNADSTVLVIEVFPAEGRSGLQFIQDMLAEVRGAVESLDRAQYAADLNVYYGGNLKNRLDEYEVVKSDILGTALYGIGGVFLLIVIFFRSFVGAALVSVSLGLSIAWTFGLTYLVIGELNTITGFLFVILFGLGIDYGIHTFARYKESRRSGLNLRDAIDKMVCQTGTAVATTAVTTAAGFLLLLFMDFKGFAHLGFIAGVGVLFAFIGMVFVLPAFIILAERVGVLRVAPVVARTEPQLEGRGIRFAVPLLSLAVLVTVLAAYLSTRVGFEYDFTNLRAMTPERQIVGEKTQGVFSRSESPAVVLADSRDEVEEIVAAVREIMVADTISPTVASVRSIFSLVPDDQTQRLETIRAIRTLVEDEAEGVLEGEDKMRLERLAAYVQVDAPFTWDEFPAEDKRQFIDTRGEIGNFVFIYPSVSLRDGRQAIAFRNDIGTITTESGKVFHAASSNIISADMLLLMIREGKLALGLAAIAVFVLVGLDFRSVKASLLVMLPLAVGFVWMGGVMFLVGMKLNFFNVVVLPSVVGIGVDNGVHIYHRYLEEGPGSVAIVLRRTGRAITMTTLTTIVGYSGLIMATHPGLNSIGYLAVIGIAATFATAVIALPSLLQVLETRKQRRSL